MRRVSITDEHGTWLGSCVVDRRGRITHCPVDLGVDPEHVEKVYRALERLIATGRISGYVGSYGFEVYEASETYEPM